MDLPVPHWWVDIHACRTPSSVPWGLNATDFRRPVNNGFYELRMVKTKATRVILAKSGCNVFSPEVSELKHCKLMEKVRSVTRKRKISSRAGCAILE